MLTAAQAFYWILPLLFGIRYVQGERCSDALFCMHIIDGVRSDLGREDLFSICSKTMKFITCIEASIKDCHVKDIKIPKDNMEQLDNSIQMAKDIYKSYCNGVTPNPDDRGEEVERVSKPVPIPSVASCEEISNCMVDVSAFTNAVSNDRPEEACSLISPSVQCMQSAVVDCETTGDVPADLMEQFKMSLVDSQSKLSRYCIDGDEFFETVSEPTPGDTGTRLKTGVNYLLSLLVSFVVTRALL